DQRLPNRRRSRARDARPRRLRRHSAAATASAIENGEYWVPNPKTRAAATACGRSSVAPGAAHCCVESLPTILASGTLADSLHRSVAIGRSVVSMIRITPTLEDRFTGCLLGLAVGDALGAPFEGQLPEYLSRRYQTARDLFANPPPGELWYTDDT